MVTQTQKFRKVFPDRTEIKVAFIARRRSNSCSSMTKRDSLRRPSHLTRHDRDEITPFLSRPFFSSTLLPAPY